MKALVFQGRVVQIESAEFPVSPSMQWVEADNDTAVGDFYDGQFLKPAQTIQSKVRSVSRFQARAALLNAGLLDQVEAMMAAPETPTLARLAWADAQEFLRESPTVLSMGAALGLDSAQLDALFAEAATINA